LLKHLIMKRECKSCKNWKPVQGTDITSDSFGNCQRIVNGLDIRMSGHKLIKLQTSASFCCKYFAAKEESSKSEPIN
jgi:hypothetical protein